MTLFTHYCVTFECFWSFWTSVVVTKLFNKSESFFPNALIHRNLASLKVEYLILHAGWCLSVERNGCALTEVWDQEDPSLKNQGKEPLCPQLWHKTPLPFVKLFKNNEYAVLRVSNKHIEIGSTTNSQTMWFNNLNCNFSLSTSKLSQRVESCIRNLI